MFFKKRTDHTHDSQSKHVDQAMVTLKAYHSVAIHPLLRMVHLSHETGISGYQATVLQLGQSFRRFEAFITGLSRAPG